MEEKDDGAPVIVVDRPTGPRITFREKQSLGELVVTKSQNLATITIGLLAAIAPSKASFISSAVPIAIGATMHFMMAGSMALLGVGTTTSSGPPPSYTGFGDVVTSGTKAYWSCARGFNAASTGANACKICDQATGIVCATATVAASGFVTIPQLAGVTCGTAGLVCVVDTAYDQSGALGCAGSTACDVVQATNANRPILTMAALGGLPCMTFAQANSTVLKSATSLTQAQPHSWSAVAERTGGFGTFSVFLSSLTTDAPDAQMSFSAGSATAYIYQGSVVSVAATDSSPHAIQGLFNGGSSQISSDGSSSSGDVSGVGSLNNIIWLGSDTGGAGASLDGFVCEAAIVSGDKSSLFSAINTNQHSSTYGYNF